MKKYTAVVLMLLTFLLSGCSENKTAQNNREIISTNTGGYKTYCELADGTWLADGFVYKYKLEISGTMPNAACGTTFVYLSNIEEITFEQAWKAAGFSSLSDDYFSPETAVLVDVINY